MAVSFSISDGPYAGWRIAWYGALTKLTKRDTLNGLRYCGCEGANPLANLTGITRNEVQLVVVHEADLGGVMRARVRWVNRGGVPLGRSRELSAAEVADVSSKLGLSEAADPAPTSAPPQEREATDNADPPRDDGGSDDEQRAAAEIDEDDLLPF